MTEPGYDPTAWRKCPVCKAETGQLCTILNGKVVDGRPDGVRIDKTDAPHNGRRPRQLRKVAFSSAPLAR